jgi:RNA polymerase sigma-70 factor (ECF subfamily)
LTLNNIILGCKSQELRSQRLLYEKYCNRLYPICIRYCKDEQSASSALHSGFLKIFQNISSIEDTNKLEAWMSRIIVHSCIDQIKADKKFSFIEMNDEHVKDHSIESQDDQSFDKYLPLLNLLPEGYRLVFCMRVLEEMSHKEIAKILEITESTSRTQLLKARSMLKQIIENKLITI